MPTAAAYIRVSTDDQAELSPDSQLEEIKNLIQERYGRMSRTQRRIGDYILNHTDTVCFQSLKQTAAAAESRERFSVSMMRS